MLSRRVWRFFAAVLLVAFLAPAGFALPKIAHAAGVKQGIDVSEWQGAVNWSQVAASGVSFAWIRFDDGAYYTDSKWQTNWYNATAAGVVPGAYLFWEPTDDPAAQAQVLIQQLQQVNFTHGDLLPVLDVETNKNYNTKAIYTPAQMAAELTITVNALTKAYGSYPVIYTSPGWWNSNVQSNAFAADPLWVADWCSPQSSTCPYVPTGWGNNSNWAAWQNGDCGSVAGIGGCVDTDRSNSTPLPFYGSAGLQPQQANLPIGVNNIAGVPQPVSDRAGNIDVIWRGTDSKLWDIEYRNQKWSQPFALTTANVASDPSVLSTASGSIDAYYRGTDGNLWHTKYQSGFFGSGAWTTAASLNVGTLQSAPHATYTGSGTTYLTWKGASNVLYFDRYNGTSSSVYPIPGSNLGGDPYPVYTGSGTVSVFWRDLSGNLYTVSISAFASGTPKALGPGGLTADPTPVSNGSGSIDLFWPAGDGTLWDMLYASGAWGGASQLSTQQVVGIGDATESSSNFMTFVTERSDGYVETVLGIPNVGLVGPELLGDGTVGSTPSVVSTGNNLWTFWRGQDSGLWYSSACPGCTQAAPALASPL